jgi:magnesium transporter
MYLSDKLNNVPREFHDHEDLELLLESFSKQVEEIVNEAENIEVPCSPSVSTSLC